jgi:hypothetical protein
MATFSPTAVGAHGYNAAVLQLQIFHLAVCQHPPMPAGQLVEPKISDSNAQEIFDAVSDSLEHASNLAIYSLSQDNAKTRGRQGTKSCNLRTSAIKENPAL